MRAKVPLKIDKSYVRNCQLGQLKKKILKCEEDQKKQQCKKIKRFLYQKFSLLTKGKVYLK